MSGSGEESWDDQEDGKDAEAHETHKIISRKAMKDFHRAKQRFLKFLMDADVWSQEQARPMLRVFPPMGAKPTRMCYLATSTLALLTAAVR